MRDLTMKYFSKKLNNRGDTIVEVLIATAVVSMILAGAFVSTNTSSNNTRSAQERGEALKLAETQVELIKIAVDSGANIKALGNFCMEGIWDPDTPPPSSCPDIGSGNLYDVVVNHTIGTSNFLVHVEWDSLNRGKNELELGYKTQ